MEVCARFGVNRQGIRAEVGERLDVAVGYNRDASRVWWRDGNRLHAGMPKLMLGTNTLSITSK